MSIRPIDCVFNDVTGLNASLKRILSSAFASKYCINKVCSSPCVIEKL